MMHVDGSLLYTAQSEAMNLQREIYYMSELMAIGHKEPCGPMGAKYSTTDSMDLITNIIDYIKNSQSLVAAMCNKLTNI
jgi:hypothetical protein